MDGASLAAPLTGERVTVQQFALGVLGELGARVEPVPGGIRAELEQERLAFLEGRPFAPAGFAAGLAASPAGEPTARAAIYLAFDPTQADEAAELVTTGSWRLEQLIAAAVRLGRLGRAWVRPPGVRPAVDRPYLIFHFLATYVGHEPKEQLFPVAVDLVSADAFALTAATPALWRLMPEGDGTPAEPARLSLGQAHERAIDALAQAVAEQDAGWLRAARLRLERELEELYSYCRTALDHEEHEAVEAAALARVRELETLARPHVLARAEAATLLYVPLRRDRSGRLYNPVWKRHAPAPS